MSKAFEKFGLDQNTIDFIGHALALHRDDEYVLNIYSFVVIMRIISYTSDT